MGLINIYSIGEISKMLKISSDTLRYYNEIQLLNPDYINPSNNYRYYTEEQIKEILYIMDLKDCGFNLEEIKAIVKLNDKKTIKQIFVRKKNQLSDQSEKINLSIERINNKLKTMEEPDMKENIKILIVDDAGFFRSVIIPVFQKNGYEKCSFIEAADGIEAIEKYKMHKPDLTFMDIAMPNMDGITAVKEIKKLDGNAKIVMVSAMSEPSYITESLVAGAVDFVAKPCQGEKLIETANKHLSQYVVIDIEEVKAWRTEYYQNFVKLYEENKKEFDESKLSEKLLEVLKSCIDISVDYDVLNRILLTAVKEYINPALRLENEKWQQHRIDSLICTFVK